MYIRLSLCLSNDTCYVIAYCIMNRCYPGITGPSTPSNLYLGLRKNAAGQSLK